MKKSQIAQMVGVILGIIVGGVNAIIIRLTTGAPSNWMAVLVEVFIFLLFVGLIYSIVYCAFVTSYQEEEDEERYFKRLTDYLNGIIKEVELIYSKNEESELLKGIVENCNFRYYAQVMGEDTIALIVTDSKGRHIDYIKISDLAYIRKHIKFKNG